MPAANSLPQPPTYIRNIQTGKSKKLFLSVGEVLGLGEKCQAKPLTYLRNIEKGKKEKKSWYQYVFPRIRRENEATEEARRMGASTPYRPINRRRLSQSNWYGRPILSLPRARYSGKEIVSG
jgi:hypothetical protein